MNIFYDDLFQKENIEDILFLKSCGYTIYNHTKPKKMTLNEVYSNLFSYLDDYKNAGFKFINFPDELVTISNNVHTFQCFGKSNFGYFVIDEDKQIYVIICKYYSSGMQVEDYFNKNNNNFINKYLELAKNNIFIIYANKNLLDFLNSYNYFLSAIYAIKGNFKSYNESLSNISNLEASYLKKQLLRIDSNAVLDYSYWCNTIEAVRDMDIMLNFQLAPYKLTDRI